ncbi:MAG TPA: hypothetical protein VFO76_13250 [Candidatus Kapabacteria bacterium]|nr:hypothetical protein [Candidatus Kapabacteria bacterium]
MNSTPNVFNNAEELMKNSLAENLEAANFCVNYNKATKPELWGNNNPGALGIPACILLMSIIDTIGAAYRKAFDAKSDRANFDVLKVSDIFSMSLADNEIKAVYDDLRSLVTHNGLIKEVIEIKNDFGTYAFTFGNIGTRKRIRVIYLKTLLDNCRHGIAYFNEHASKMLAISRVDQDAKLKVEIQRPSIKDAPSTGFDTYLTPSK